jgi:hypothetical protein
MKLSEYRKKSNEYTAKASEIGRQLSLAGVAIIWLFKNDNKNQPILAHSLLMPLILLAGALTFDLLQYIIGGQIWISFFRRKEKEAKGSDPDIKAPSNYNLPIYICYYLKLLMLLLAYGLIVIFLVKKIN